MYVHKQFVYLDYRPIMLNAEAVTFNVHHVGYELGTVGNLMIIVR
jgi:hypothetical protein